MREKPQIPDELLQTTLQDQYNINSITLEFLPLGLDYHAGGYRVVSDQGNAYFLKVTSRPLYAPRYQVPRYLNDHGITSVVAPLPTSSGNLWVQLEHWTAIVYPFINGDSSFTGMKNEHWKKLGGIFKQIHHAAVSSEWFESLRQETFDVAEYVRWIDNFETQDLHTPQAESTSQHTLRVDWLTHHDIIHTTLNSLEKLAGTLRRQSGSHVFCHADLHAANLISDSNGHVFVIDWDDVMLAPKERDFIFIRDPGADAFWEGYGEPHIDWIALTYYRCERVIQDVIACAEDMFFKHDVGEETRADIAELFHDILLGNTSTINDVYTAAAHLPADLTLE